MAVGRWLLFVLIQAGACWSALAESPEQSPSTSSGSPQEYEHRGLLKIKAMMMAHQLTEWQFARIKYLLQEQHTMIDLFAKYGLLGEGELREKISTIQQVTSFGVDDILTPDLLGIWEAWDVKLDAAEAEKRRVRRRLPPAP